MKHKILFPLALILASCGGGDEDGGSTVWAQPPATNNSSGAMTAAVAGGTPSAAGTSAAEQEAIPNPAALPRGQQPTTGCERFYVLGKQPRIVNPELNKALTPKMENLCYRAFAVSYSGLTRTPIWVAEALSARQLDYARTISRNSEFAPDPSLSIENRAELSDYRGSGFDRGHMAPSADMPTREAQAESFYLSNIVPQNAALNGGKWARLEQSVRNQARRNDVYVVTGPIFQNARQALKKRVLVPTSIFKAIFIDGEGAVVYVAENKANGRWDTMTVDQFKSVYGIDLYPGLPPLIRSSNYATGGSLRPRPGAGGATSANGTGIPGRKKEVVYRENGTGMIYTYDQFVNVYKRTPRSHEIVEY